MSNFQFPISNNSSGRQITTTIIGIFLITGFLIYGQTLWFDFVEFDDTLLVIDNISVITAGSWSAVTWAFGHYDPELYIPLTFLSFQLDASIGGLNPWIFHLDNVLQHIASALLTTWIIKLLFKRLDVAIVLGLLFLVHPLNVEATAWVSGRKDLLSTLFAFGSMVAYLKGMKWWSIALFVCGLLAKVSVAPLPLVFLLVDHLQGRRINIKNLWNKKWYFLASLLIGLIALLGKDQVLARTSTENVLLLIPRTIIFYVEKLLVPLDLSIFYPYPEAHVLLSYVPVLLSWIIFIAVVAVLWKLRRTVPALYSGALIVFLLLVPSFFQYYRGSELYLATDRYLYLPFIGILIALAPLLKTFINRFDRIAYIASVSVLAILAILAFFRAQVWQNTYTLFANALETSESFLAYEKVGAWLLREGKEAEAVEALKRSIELAPSSAAFFRLGVAAMNAGNIEDAKLFTQEALKLSPENPQAHVNMSKFYWDEGNQWLALDHAKKAVEYHPWNMMALGNLATMYTLTNQKTEALEVIDAILDLDPDNERVRPLQEKLTNTQ